MAPAHYRKVLSGYLAWGDAPGMGEYNFDYSSAQSAEDAMCDWESRGITPTACTTPGLLAKYIIGKKWRDWHVAEWTRGILEGTIFLHELISDPALRDRLATINLNLLPKSSPVGLRATI